MIENLKGEQSAAQTSPNSGSFANDTRDQANEAILAALQQRDPQALDMLYNRFAGPAYSLALNLLGDPAEAEKVMVEAFSAIWQNPASLGARPNSIETRLLAAIHFNATQQLQSKTEPTPSTPRRETLQPQRAPIIPAPRFTFSRVDNQERPRSVMPCRMLPSMFR